MKNQELLHVTDVRFGCTKDIDILNFMYNWFKSYFAWCSTKLSRSELWKKKPYTQKGDNLHLQFVYEFLQEDHGPHRSP